MQARGGALTPSHVAPRSAFSISPFSHGLLDCCNVALKLAAENRQSRWWPSSFERRKGHKDNIEPRSGDALSCQDEVAGSEGSDDDRDTTEVKCEKAPDCQRRHAIVSRTN
ncbi:protein of unknown function (plasmid) [Pararobbsia alpina]